MLNPAIAGFHPDPSVVRVGDDYYLACSSFEYFPGVPLFHSTDAERWTPIGHVVTRPGQLAIEHVPTGVAMGRETFATRVEWVEGRPVVEQLCFPGRRQEHTATRCAAAGTVAFERFTYEGCDV